MPCFRCDENAVQECPRCGALYCDAHGDALCERCMDPALALPSYRVYRGSLIALLIGSIFAVWLLVLPPVRADQDAAPSSLAGSVVTPEGDEASADPDDDENDTDENEGDAESQPTSTPEASATPEPTETPEPTPTATPEPETITHTVQPGETLLLIAGQYVPAGGSVDQFADQIAIENGLADSSQLQIGQELIIPGS